MAKKFGFKLIKLVEKLELEEGPKLNSSCTIECFEIGRQKDSGFRYAVKIWGMGDPKSFIYDGTWREAVNIQAPSEILV